MKVSEVMTTPVVTVHPGASLNEAARLLGDRHINALPVTDEDGQLLGMVTETDVFRALALRLGIGLSPTARLDHAHAPRRIADIMRPASTSVHRHDTVAMCLAAMARSGGEAVPVLDTRRVVGIITRREALRALADVDRESVAGAVDQGRLPAAHDVLVTT